MLEWGLKYKKLVVHRLHKSSCVKTIWSFEVDPSKSHSETQLAIKLSIELCARDSSDINSYSKLFPTLILNLKPMKN